MITKICTKCGAEKALTDYHRSQAYKDGRKGECKACAQMRYQAYRISMHIAAPNAKASNYLKTPTAPSVITLAAAVAICREKMRFHISQKNLISLVRKYPQLGESMLNKTGTSLVLAGINANRWRGFLDGRGCAKNPSELFEETL